MAQEQNKKKEEKSKNYKTSLLVSLNASKSKQATSRKKQLEKIELDDIQPSSRRYPYVKFTQKRNW